jgi:hypothetical protein
MKSSILIPGPLEKQLKALINLFETIKIPYAILGGLAVILYGEPRLTMDIDVNISLPSNHIGQFLIIAKKTGFLPSCNSVKTFVKKTGVIPMKFMKTKPPGRCDIIIAENSLEHMALKRAKLKKIGSLNAKFITAEDLLIHKIASDRPRDIEDLKGILMRQRNKLDISYILFWLKKLDEANKSSLVSLFKSLLH